jgi:hypothetical protein
MIEGTNVLDKIEFSCIHWQKNNAGSRIDCN